MNDVVSYFEIVQKIVDTAKCAKIERVGPKWNPDRERWLVVTFRATLIFDSGEIFKVSDNHSRKNKQRQPQRKFSYYFGSGGCPIFLFDNHGKVNHPCHVHLSTGGARYQDGDPALNGYSIAEIGFPMAFSLAVNYLKGKPLPWVQA